MSSATKRSCASRLTVAIASARAAAPPGGIITRWSQNRRVAAFVRSWRLGEPLLQLFELRIGHLCELCQNAHGPAPPKRKLPAAGEPRRAKDQHEGHRGADDHDPCARRAG